MYKINKSYSSDSDMYISDIEEEYNKVQSISRSYVIIENNKVLKLNKMENIINNNTGILRESFYKLGNNVFKNVFNNVSNKSSENYKCKNKKIYTPPPAPKVTRKRLHKNWAKSRIKWENKNWNKNIIFNKNFM